MVDRTQPLTHEEFMAKVFADLENDPGWQLITGKGFGLLGPELITGDEYKETTP